MDMPEGCDYDLTLYSEYGNQVKHEVGQGRTKNTDHPNWDTNTNKYCIKMKTKMGKKFPQMIIKISFKVSENKEQGKDRCHKRWHSGTFTVHTARKMKIGGIPRQI